MVYRAPEMLDLYAAKPIDEKADIWVCAQQRFELSFINCSLMHMNVNACVRGASL